jgi:hypothetical protein
MADRVFESCPRIYVKARSHFLFQFDSMVLSPPLFGRYVANLSYGPAPEDIPFVNMGEAISICLIVQIEHREI